VRTFADLLGYERQARVLQKTLDEEGRTDHLLTDVAEDRVNPEARS
jgi:ferritin-like metal-binding protein YciE